MVAGIGSMKKFVEKAQRRFSKTNNLDELRTTMVELFGDINRLKKANEKLMIYHLYYIQICQQLKQLKGLHQIYKDLLELGENR